jgi:DNA-binding response OmpR family regulator
MERTVATQPTDQITSPQILIVEDDVPLADFLRRQLEAEHYKVSLAHDGKLAIENLSSSNYDLVILDLNLPVIDGVTVLKQLRPSKPNLPVLVLTARSRVEDRVESLDTGADDCLMKPFSIIELSARVRALLRRHTEKVEQVTTVSDLVLNRVEWRVERGGNKIDLTTREFALLEYLMRNARRPVTRTELMEQVWNQAYDPSTNLVDVYVKYVRDKVDAGHTLKLIRTIRGLGYVLTDEV